MPDIENSAKHTKLTATKEPEQLTTADIESFSVKQAENEIQIDTDYAVYSRMGMIALFVIFVVFGGWASFAPLNSALVAPGAVVVISNNRVVQHLEGGMVDKILISEGQSVKQGDVLLKLSPTLAKAELQLSESRLNEILGIEARLLAERKFKESVSFPERLVSQTNDAQVKEVIEGQQDVFSARKQALDGEIFIYRQKEQALKEQIIGLQSVIRNLDARIASYESDVKDWQALLNEQFTDKIRLQEMQRSLSRLKGERGTDMAEVAQLKVQIAETKSQVILRKQQFSEKVVSELRKIQAEKTDVETRLVTLRDRLSRVQILAPVTGRVNALTVYTVGQVVTPGEKLMEIVPETKNYAVKAKVKVTDIDKVYPGLIADIRFSAFNTQTTHVIEGEVIHVSADKFTDQDSGNEYFEAKVKMTDAGTAQMQEDKIFLLPGMPAEVMIKVGERTLLEYFVKPFSDMLARSFNEE
jgi:epimerase transport system membrane fusion protein